MGAFLVCVCAYTVHGLCGSAQCALHTISAISHPHSIHDSLQMTEETYSLYLEWNWCHNHAWTRYIRHTHANAQQSIKIKFPSSNPVRCVVHSLDSFVDGAFFGKRLSTNFIVYIVNEAQWEVTVKERTKFALEIELTQSDFFSIFATSCPPPTLGLQIALCIIRFSCIKIGILYAYYTLLVSLPFMRSFRFSRSVIGKAP